MKRPRNSTPTRFRLPVPALLLAALLAGCQEVRVPGVYRIDIQQGNVITQEQLAALEPGMEKRKVRFILGTPLVADAFNQDRWDYYYSFEKSGDERVQRLISVFFEDERLVRVGGDVRPARGPIVVDSRKDELVTVPKGYRDEGILAALTPGLFSRREKFTPPEPPAGAEGRAAAAEDATAASPADIRVTAEDERYLRDLFEGFGDVTPGATVPAAVAAAAPAPAPSENEEEGLFSRWARQLGLTDDEAPPEPPALE